ncbi:DEAD/DEAH box helicase [Corynebacterium sp. 335C]
MSNTDSVTGDAYEPDNVQASESQDSSQDGTPITVGEVLEGRDAGISGDDDNPETTTASDTAGDNGDAPADAQDDARDDEATGGGAAAHDGGTADEDQDEDDQDDEAGTGFDGLELPDDVVDAVAKVGFESPSPIQAATIPTLMSGRDVVGLAQTGTGKTAAFALPILARIAPGVRRPQALVLAPTRELALQVADSFQQFADHLGGIHVLPIYGGQSYGVQLSGLRRGAQVIVGTPGRVIDHLEKGSLDISELRFLVLDEADEMLQMGFQEDVERILADTPDDKQVALFSATMPAAIRRLSKQYLTDPEEITVKSETRTADNIRQRFLMTAHRNKLDALTRILEVEEFEAMIVFVRTKQNTEELAEKLRARGFTAAAINGDNPQSQRERTIDQLKDGRLDILVATDVAARGLDVDRISHVVNFDIPHDTESYVHRIGRTGRAGRSGEALLFVTPREGRLLRSIEKATKSKLHEMHLPSVDEVNDSRREKFADSITEALADSQVPLFRELIERYAEEHDTPVADIAAALATMGQAGDFYMKEAPKQERRRDRDRDRFDRDRGDRRGDRGDRGDRGGDRGKKAEPVQFERKGTEIYKINVGHRNRVRPGAIVGAIANEGGLNSKDFGHIDIREFFTLVELPANLPKQVLDNLADTRIAGRNINIQVDEGAPEGDDHGRGGHGHGGRGGHRGDRGDRAFDRDRDRGDRGHGGRGFDRDRGNGRRFDRDRDDRGDRGHRGGDRGGFRDRDDRGGRGGHRGGRNFGDRDRGGRRDRGFGGRDGGDRRGGRGFKGGFKNRGRD